MHSQSIFVATTNYQQDMAIPHEIVMNPDVECTTSSSIAYSGHGSYSSLKKHLSTRSESPHIQAPLGPSQTSQDIDRARPLPAAAPTPMLYTEEPLKKWSSANGLVI